MDFIIALIVLIILGSAIGYIVHAKRKGVKCIGCSVGSSCSGHCSEQGCSCSHEDSDGQP